MKKGTAFCITTAIMTLLSVIALLWPERSGNIIGILSVIAGFGTCYIGLQVCDNGVKGKFWSQEMYDSTKKRGE